MKPGLVDAVTLSPARRHLLLAGLGDSGTANFVRVSYDMFVQRFENGDAAVMEGSAFHEVWEPYTAGFEARFGLWHICADDGGEAEIYARVEGEVLNSLMISRFSNGRVLDLLVEFVAVADAVVLPPGCPALLAHEDQRRHLPSELRADAVVVHRGADVERVLQAN